MTKYGKYESDGLWSTKWTRWTVVDKMNGMDFGIWIKQRWSDGEIMQQHKQSWGGVHKHKPRWWNKMVTHNILLLQLTILLHNIQYIEMVWLLFFLIQSCSLMFLEVQSHSLEVQPILQVKLLTCYVLLLVRFLCYCLYNCHFQS